LIPERCSTDPVVSFGPSPVRPAGQINEFFKAADLPRPPEAGAVCTDAVRGKDGGGYGVKLK
jgi:hypothetical protein